VKLVNLKIEKATCFSKLDLGRRTGFKTLFFSISISNSFTQFLKIRTGDFSIIITTFLSNTRASSLFFFFGGTGVWIQASCLQSRCFTAWATPSVHFALVILEMRSQELFAQAGLELWSSWSYPPKQLRSLVWATGTWLQELLVSNI
jgi:hypothetical protein